MRTLGSASPRAGRGRQCLVQGLSAVRVVTSNHRGQRRPEVCRCPVWCAAMRTSPQVWLCCVYGVIWLHPWFPAAAVVLLQNNRVCVSEGNWQLRVTSCYRMFFNQSAVETLRYTVMVCVCVFLIPPKSGCSQLCVCVCVVNICQTLTPALCSAFSVTLCIVHVNASLISELWLFLSENIEQKAKYLFSLIHEQVTF